MQSIEEICITIKTQLEKHGFPAKKVSFPKIQIETFLTRHDFELEDLTRQFSSEEVTIAEHDNKLVFAVQLESSSSSVPDFGPFDEALKHIHTMDPEELRKKAEEIQKTLTPEQQKQIMDMFNNLSPEERQSLMSKFGGL